MLANCSRCGGKIEIDGDTIVGDVVVCLDCGAPHIVKSIDNGIARVEYREIEVFWDYFIHGG
jgi:DNA-directed RNA polymerase subunit RPC12/RpoP